MKKIKHIRWVLLSSITLLFGFSTMAQNIDDKALMDQYISDLMSRMTLREKIGQLNLPTSGDITTGAMQSSNVAEKVRRGEVGGLFNIKGAEKIYEIQRIAIEESRLGIPLLFGMDVIHGYETIFPIPLSLASTWDREGVRKAAEISAIEASADGINWTFSPMADVSRDPRWGRMAEGFGEDPYLQSVMAVEMIKGYQGDYSKPHNIMACIKHFALYGASEAGRDYNTVDMSRINMFNYYFPPFEAAVKAGVGSIMSSFNVVDGIPATGNHWLLTEVLRDKWGYDNFVTADYTGVSEMVAHGMGNLQQVSALAINAGTDMDMVSEGYLNTLEQSVVDALVCEETIDNACRRILEAKYKLGLFKDPYKFCKPNRSRDMIYSDEHRAFARSLATESFILLKNEAQLLPLKKEGTIALIGPLGDTRENMPGTWSVSATFNKYKSLKEGLEDALKGKAQLLYAKGSNLMYDPQREAEATMFGREMRDQRSPETLLAEALHVANQSDVIIVAVGEASEMSGESSSRTNLTLPDAQKDLLMALKETGKPIVILYFAGRGTVMTWEDQNFSTILLVGFGGSESADAIADVVFGEVSPSGKLVSTFPKNEGQIPLYYNHLNTGRPLDKNGWFTKFQSNYLDVDNDPLYPFGFGLSYTTFEYSNLILDKETMNGADDIITVSIDVTNTGAYDAAEVVQLYIRDLVATISRPVKELKNFERIFLKSGETKPVSFSITAMDLSFYNSDLERVIEPGEFCVMVGPNSRDLKLANFVLVEQ